MSIDTSLADPISNLSPWEQLRAQLFAEREIANAALRQQLAATPPGPRTAAELRLDIRRFNSWLDTMPVQAGGSLANWIRDRKAAAMAELANLTAGGAK